MNEESDEEDVRQKNVNAGQGGDQDKADQVKYWERTVQNKVINFNKKKWYIYIGTYVCT